LVKVRKKDGSIFLTGKIFQGGNGWVEGAEYTVEDGTIVGRTVANSRNTFLITEKEYGDLCARN
jgi:hypothetical protein